MGQLVKGMRGSRTWDVVECYNAHRRIAGEWFSDYGEYVRLMADLTPSRPFAVLRNRFPYDVPYKQCVVWSLNGQFPADVDNFVRMETLHAPANVFENAPADRSVPQIRHMHARIAFNNLFSKQ